MNCMTYFLLLILFSSVNLKKVSVYVHPYSPDITRCDFINGEDTNVNCYGKSLMEIPNNLSRYLSQFSITQSGIKHITKSSFDRYREEMRDVTLSDLPYLRVIEDGTFSDMPKLRTLYITHAPQIMFLHGLLKGVTSHNFYSLRIVWTKLTEIPDLYDLSINNNTLFLLDLDHNNIQHIQANAIKVIAQQVQMHHNPQLRTLGINAFSGIKSLWSLDLSRTSITRLPSEGLQELETLKIEATHTMQTIPSIYDLGKLTSAKLTHSFHCCAFRYPEQHDPSKHAQYTENLKKICELANSDSNVSSRKRRSSSKEWPYTFQGSENLTSSDYLLRSRMFGAIHPIKGKALGREEGRVINTMKNDDFNEDDGFFHLVTKVNDTEANNQCGNIVIRIPEVECLPDPDALNPCEDIMGMSWLRISVWCVVVLALLGNLAVMIVFLFGPTEINVARFLICNLAFADFCMGLYLLLIASMDFHSVGEYFNFAYNWQYGIGCQIAGFLTVFSSHLSIYTLTIITLERWFAITYAIHLTKRITIKCAMYILLGGWVYSFIIAILPVVGISNYSSTSICLPMESKEVVDKIYLYTVIFINGAAFALIVFCYVQIYLSLGYETRRASTKGEMTIAKKMSLLVLVDFATVAPVAFFGLTALAGYPLIGVTKSKILLVFFYPLNACANPYLYAVMTAQYRQDFLKLVSRCKNCNRHIEPHKTDSVPLSISNHTHKNGYCATHG
ncbi:lutropin-choriogonadotropic hormone receptor-like isoform X2 [Diabrotica virgifera virgifera]|uniref:G-protein coupled receptors family 1 profile domain-containing protein n=1 Tax=Diabrotica virgifera virgifera TaxID=50390 RepID=A0ABM5K6T3_DIAVI|nr:lutropin-choriogonadotropic hormone receptor-like isoform X2 [Diabrotica virgifera virgifera]